VRLPSAAPGTVTRRPCTALRLLHLTTHKIYGIMGFLAAANFVVSAIHTILLFAG
jgi:hypothetical protein